MRSRTEIEQLKGGKEQIIVTEIPYDVNKAVLVKKIDDVRVNNKVPGIAEVRDESDRTGLRIAIELKKDADSQTILNYLLKYTDLQVNYNFNMVAIDNFTPRQVGLQKILSSYIAHRRDIIVARSKFDKEKAEKRLHIVEGLIRVISILDEVIALIRASENKADAKENLKVSYDFSEEQAEAIVTLQLYRLTNTDIVTLQNEEADLREQIATLAAIIGDERTMFNVMKRELRDIKKKFGNDRRSELQAETKTIEIDTASLIVEEETYVSITRGGYVKRTSPRSFNASTIDEVGKRDDDDLILVQQAKTTQHLLIFTNQANVIYRQSMSYQTFVGRIWESIYHKLSPIYLRMKKCFTQKSWMILKQVLTYQLPSWVRLNVSNARNLHHGVPTSLSRLNTLNSRMIVILLLRLRRFNWMIS